MNLTADLGIIHAAADRYRTYLCDRRVLFIPNDGSIPLEVMFEAGNFMHLCGIDYPVTRKSDFLELAVRGRLQPELLEYKYDRNTDLKLEILNTLMMIDSKAMLFSFYPSLPGNTKADCVAVNRNAVLGFVEKGSKRVPDTALNLLRQWEDPHMVLAVIKTEPLKSRYTLCTKEPTGRKLNRDKITRILSSLKRYDGGSDITPMLNHFHNLLIAL